MKADLSWFNFGTVVRLILNCPLFNLEHHAVTVYFLTKNNLWPRETE